ncbi:hypothetical protein LCGC14_1839560 [marine sediment metagenome]|uniref:histidine kinase n=1 Tax=marine sediment metagenome TaxID=412755 RepID=A0A0F9IT24_9ZZZZ
MNDSEGITTHPAGLGRCVWVLAAAWTVVVVSSLVWNVLRVKQETLEDARIQARALHAKDIVYRRWVAGHGGVYVPVTAKTPPNPYLSRMPERNITTPSGRQLTLINPAYMTRQVHELADQEHGIRGHITSLKPIRPENAPDPWEAKALQAFERGQREVSSVQQEYMRLMRPLITEKGCLKCHAAQGYREGDIRGGISISVPMAPLKAIAARTMLTLGMGHLFLWSMGMGGIILGTQRLRRKESDRSAAAQALQEAKDDLQTRVEERTSELSIANKQLSEEITERKQAEEEIGSLAKFPDENPDPILRAAGDGNITFANNAAQVLLDAWSCQVGQALPKQWAELVASVLVSGAREDVEIECDGRTFLVTFAPVVDAGYVNLYGRNITERKQVDEELAKHRYHLEELVEQRTGELATVNKELESFGYSVSHDLRAPLRGMVGFSHALLEDYEDKLDEQGKQYLSRIAVGGKLMAQLIDDILNLSRVARSQMQRETVDLSTAAREVAARLREDQPERKVEFVIADGLAAEGDRRLLDVVLANLLGNAWKFTGGHPTATIEFGVTDVENERVYFVRDDGAGFDMAYADKLFGAFQRLHSEEEFPGTGIGLATVQRIVRRHGGRAWAEGEIDKGATFYFTLPARGQPDETVPRESPSRRKTVLAS